MLFLLIYSIADRKNHNKEYTQKEGVKKLTPKGIFSCSFTIEVYNNFLSKLL